MGAIVPPITTSVRYSSGDFIVPFQPQEFQTSVRAGSSHAWAEKNNKFTRLSLKMV